MRKLSKHPSESVWSIAALLLTLLLAACGPRTPTIDGGRLGMVRLFHPSDAAHALVIVFSDADGWTNADDAAADHLASAGTIVAGVDLPGYLAILMADKSDCLYLVNDAERLSRTIERSLGLAVYQSPILAGVGEGGRLALAMLQQAPPSTLAGAAAVDPAAEIPTARHLCRQPPQDAGVPSAPGTEKQFISFSGQAFSNGQAAGILAKLHEVGARPRVEPLVAASNPQGSLAALLMLHVLPATQSATAMTTLSDLPLIELPGPPGAPLAVVLSGDGGWRDIDKQIAEALQQAGYSVLGWDSLRYFWSAKSPEILGRDLGLALAAYETRWHTSRILLVGFSFGADVLPFAFNRLPAGLRKRVQEISLLGYSGRADFEIQMTGWLGAPPSDAALDAGPEMAHIDSGLIQCFYGSEEADSACPRLSGSKAEIVRLDGGHHLGGQYAEIARRIVSGAAERAAFMN